VECPLQQQQQQLLLLLQQQTTTTTTTIVDPACSRSSHQSHGIAGEIPLEPGHALHTGVVECPLQQQQQLLLLLLLLLLLQQTTTTTTLVDLACSCSVHQSHAIAGQIPLEPGHALHTGVVECPLQQQQLLLLQQLLQTTTTTTLVDPVCSCS